MFEVWSIALILANHVSLGVDVQQPGVSKITVLSVRVEPDHTPGLDFRLPAIRDERAVVERYRALDASADVLVLDRLEQLEEGSPFTGILVPAARAAMAEGTSGKTIEKVLDVIATGVGMPQFVNPDIMLKPPRPPKEPIINRQMQLGIVVQTIAITAVTLGAYWIGRMLFPEAVAKTMAFVTLSFSELLRAFTARSENYPILCKSSYFRFYKTGFFTRWVAGRFNVFRAV